MRIRRSAVQTSIVTSAVLQALSSHAMGAGELALATSPRGHAASCTPLRTEPLYQGTGPVRRVRFDQLVRKGHEPAVGGEDRNAGARFTAVTRSKQERSRLPNAIKPFHVLRVREQHAGGVSAAPRIPVLASLQWFAELRQICAVLRDGRPAGRRGLRTGICRLGRGCQTARLMRSATIAREQAAQRGEEQTPK